MCGYARLLLLKTFLRAKALTDADVCIVFIADFACVGSMNEIRLKNIVQAHSNLLSLPWGACSVIFYPEKARGYSQFQFSPSEKHAAAADGVARSGNGDESDPDVLVDDTAVLPAVTVGTKRKKTYRELRALLAKDKADIDLVLGRGNLGVWCSVPRVLFHQRAEQQRSTPRSMRRLCAPVRACQRLACS